MKALLIPVEGAARPVEVRNGDGGATLEDLQRLVGGDFETGPYPGRDDVAPYWHAEGKYAGAGGQPLPRNERATGLLAPTLFDGDWIAGDLVLLGFDAATGESRSLPEDLTLPAPPDLDLLLAEPKIHRGERRVRHDWLLTTDDDGQRHYLVLTVRYNSGGVNYFSGRNEPRCYEATFGRETERDVAGGTIRGFRAFSAMLVERSDEVGRYSQKRLEEFVPVARSRLRVLATEGNGKVARYFEDGAA